jgi:hypothetical protein
MAKNSTKTLTGWIKGANNTAADIEVGATELRDAVNMDVRASGTPVTRKGIRQTVGSAGAHSIFGGLTRMFWATATQLYVSTDGVSKTLLATDAKYNAPISWLELNGEVYFSNEQINGKITAAGALEPWGIVPPNSPSAGDIVAATNPAHGAVLYQFTYTFVLASGEESGAPLAARVPCGEVIDITVSSIPQSADARVVATRLYATAADGEQFYRVADVPAGTTSWHVSDFPSGGRQLTTQFNGPPPCGQLLEYHNGVIYIAADNVVWRTDALNYGIVDNVGGYFAYPARVTLLKAVPDGLYLSMLADRTYFLQGVGTDDVTQKVVSNSAAIEGAACNIPSVSDVAWFDGGLGGVVIGKEGGIIESITAGRFVAPQYARGSMTFVSVDGHQRLLGVFGAGAASANENAGYAAGEARRVAAVS